MAKPRRRVAEGVPSMPEELVSFRFGDWHDPADVDGFEAPLGADPATVEEHRFAYLAAKAKARQTDARWRWRVEHEGCDLPPGVRMRA